MALLDNKNPRSVETLLSEPAILRLLKLLVEDVLCVTAGQAHTLLRAGDDPSGGAHRLHKLARSALHKLEHGTAGYLASEPVKWLPPATIGNGPVVVLERAWHSMDSDTRALLSLGEWPVYRWPDGVHHA